MRGSNKNGRNMQKFKTADPSSLAPFNSNNNKEMIEMLQSQTAAARLSVLPKLRLAKQRQAEQLLP